MEAIERSKILAKSPAGFVTRLARPVMEKYGVHVLRQPAKNLVMIRMRETVAKADFYLGEMPAVEALVELEGQRGFALQMGDDTEKALAAAVVDAVCQTELPERQAVEQALAEQGRALQEAEERARARHAGTRVHFETLDEFD